MKLNINNISIVHVHNNVNTHINVTPAGKSVNVVLEPDDENREYTIMDEKQAFNGDHTLQTCSAASLNRR